jgi:alkanesulfonate monooxygenase SsuD/methylene tetrahydromethanopterin reductase-like flavin-dependent oxidoreductase (luciferase family)
MELGLYTFAETTPSPEKPSIPTSPQRRMCELVEEAVLAEQVGLDVFGVGEHHRSDFIVSSPAVVLGAIAARTARIRLTSAVTVLSSDDPVRVFQDFATIDLLSNGRAEIMAGRGSFIESFPLFGFDLEDYDDLFAEKLDLLLRIREDLPVTWSGRHRAPLRNQLVMPRPVQHPLPVWIAVGGTPASAERTGSLGLPMALASIAVARTDARAVRPPSLAARRAPRRRSAHRRRQDPVPVRHLRQHALPALPDGDAAPHGDARHRALRHGGRAARACRTRGARSGRAR